MPLDLGRPYVRGKATTGRGSRAMTNNGLNRRPLLRGTAAAGVVTVAGIRAVSAVADVPGFYNPFSAYPISGTWQDHINEGSLGGIDFGMAVGTALPACGAGGVLELAG